MLNTERQTEERKIERKDIHIINEERLLRPNLGCSIYVQSLCFTYLCLWMAPPTQTKKKKKKKKKKKMMMMMKNHHKFGVQTKKKKKKKMMMMMMMKNHHKFGVFWLHPSV